MAVSSLFQSALAQADSTAPFTVSMSPADNATGVAPGASLSIVFSEAIAPGSGSIRIHNADGTLARSIAVDDAAQVTFAGSVVTINPTLDLAAGRGYYVNFAAGVFQDMAGNAHAGMAGSATYNFFTASPSVGDDYPLSPDTSGVVVVDGPVASGVIEVAEDVDLFKVTLAAGTKYTFTLSSTTGGLSDPFLSLYGADMALLKSDDDSGGSGNARISFTAQSSGVHYLSAADFGAGAGAYLLTAAVSSDAADDFGASTQASGLLTVGESASGGINFAGDHDWFRIDLVAGVNYAFELGGADSGRGSLGTGLAEAWLQLFDASGAYLRASADGGAGGDPRLSYTAPASGSYYLSVSDLYDMGLGSYTLSASLGNDDFGDDASTLGRLAAGGASSGTLEVVGDDDWFAITLSAGATYRFELGTSNSGGGTLGAGDAEGYLRLFGADATLIDYAFEGSGGVDPVLLYTASRSGLHFLSVSELLGVGSGTYTLRAAKVATSDVTAPLLTGAMPADEAGAVPVGANLILTFDEAIVRGSGSVTLRQADGTLVESFDAATSSLLTFIGTNLTVNPTALLGYGTLYRLELAPGVVRDAAGNSHAGLDSYNFTTEPVPNVAPVGAVTIAGTLTQGQSLSASNTLSDADGLGPLKYQWLADGQAIAGATSATLVLDQAQVGKKISVSVSYIDGRGAAEAVPSAQTLAVANINDVATGALVLSGAALQGATLSVSNPTLQDPDGVGQLEYQWYANGTAIAGAQASALTLSQAEVGKAISVVQSFTDGFGTREQFMTAASSAVANVNDAGSAYVAGSAGSLSAVVDDADGLGPVSYQWQASSDGMAWAPIEGATQSSYAPQGAYLNMQVRVVASYTDLFGKAEVVTSAAAGSAAAERIAGTAGPDRIDSGAGNDTITGGAGDDVIEGGAGTDTAVFSGPSARYTVMVTKTGVVVSDTAGTDGVDSLSGIERLMFGSEALALDTGAGEIGGQAYRLYQAAFSRTPDLAGVGFWIGAMDRGSTLPEVAAGLDFWTNVLDNKLSTVPEVLAAISESGENIALSATVIGAGFAYTPFP